MVLKKVIWAVLAAGSAALAILVVSPLFRGRQTLAQSGPTLPQFGHVVIVTLEDHSYSQTVATLSDGVTPVCPAPSNAPMPNLQALICNEGLATKYYAETHSAIGNYFTLANGLILTNNGNYTPGSSMSCSDSSTVACSNGGLGYQSVANIASQMEATYGAGSWKAYVECIPYAGYTTSNSTMTCPSGVPNSTDKYYIRHDILAYFTNVNQTNRVPFYVPSSGEGFAQDVSYGTLPKFSYIGPDGCDNAHDCSLSTADTWLQNKVIAPLQQSSYFQSQGDGLLIITFDEDNNTGSGCTLQTGTDCGGHVATVIVSPYIVRQNYLQTSGDSHNASMGYEHQNVLRLTAQGLGLTTYPGDSATANNMSEFFTMTPVTVSPVSLTFGNQYLNTTSPAQSVTLSNPQSTALSITSIAFTGSNPGDFGQTSTCGSSLAAGTNCTINVTFKPTVINARSATLTITDNSGNSPQTISLTGAGINSGATLSPSSLTFSSLVVGNTGSDQAITLTNTGTTTLSISSIAISNDFGETNNCGGSVTAGSSCAINVTFTPTVAGTRTGTLTVTDNATTSPQTAALTGAGVVGTCSVPAIVRVQNNIDTTTTAHTSFSVNITTQPGDLLVAFVRESSNITDNFTVADSAGQHWTPTASGYKNESSTGPRIGMFYMANSATVTSVTASYTTSGGVIKPGIMVMEISGAATSGVLDSSVNGGTNANVTTSNSGSLTTTYADDILIFATDTWGNESGWTAGAGYAIPNNNVATGISGSNVRQAMQYQVVSSVQTNTTTSMTYPSTNGNGNVFAAFKGAGSEVGSSPPVLVQVQNKIDTSGTAFPSYSVNITTQPGDLLVAFVRESSNITDNFTVADSAGQHWTQTSSGYRAEISTAPRIGMFYVANSAAVTSVTANYTTSGGVIKPGIMVMEISGAALSAVEDGSVNNASASTTTSTSGSLTTANATDILIFATDVANDQFSTGPCSAAGWCAGTGYTIPNNNLATGGSGSDIRMAMQYAVVHSARANTTTSMTYNNAAWNGNIFAAFEANSSGASSPVVSAGANQTIFLPTNTANLVGSVTNNWLRCTLTSQWSQVSGPGTVTFGNASQPATTATFPNSAGDYVLQLTANNGFGSSSNQVTIIVAVPAVAISLSPPSAGPDVVGATQTMTAVVTSGAAAVPVIGVTVQFGVTGANPQTVPETTDPTGTATFPLQGANSGTDTVQASYGGATSNTATVSWLVPSPNVSTSTILGRFFPNPNNTGTFDVLPTATPVFSQYFPTILFNPPTGTVNNLACSIVNTNARPFTDVTTDATANFKGSVIAQGNGVQAGVGSLNAFEAVFTGQFTVKSAGSVTFNIYSDDGFILGVGGGATRVSGPMSNAPASGATTFNNMSVVGANNGAVPPPSFVQAQSHFLPEVGAGGSDGNLNVNAGDLLLVVPKWSPQTAAPNTATVASISDSLGNQWLQIGPTQYTSGATNPITGSAAFAAIATSNGADIISYTVTPSMDMKSIGVYEAAGLDACAESSQLASGTGSNVNSGNLSISDAEWLAEIADSYGGSFGTYMLSAPPFTARIGQGPHTDSHQDEIYIQDNAAVSPAGSYSFNGTLSDVTDWSSMFIGLPPRPSGNGNVANTVVVNFPAAGTYPFEVDYTECCGGGLTLTMTQSTTNSTNGKGIPSAGSLVLTPTNPASKTAGPTQTQTFTVTATDASGAAVPNANVSFVVSGMNLVQSTGITDPTGHVSFTYTGYNVGGDFVEATANLSGMTAYSNVVNMVWNLPSGGSSNNTGTNPIPILQGWIGSPTAGQVVEGQIPITVASGITLTSETLTYRPTLQNPPNPIPIPLNCTTTCSGTIATFDPTLLPNGGYTIQLSATNSLGITQVSQATVTVVGQYKPGRMTATVTDFKVPLAGIPIAVTRTYDSLDRSKSEDFGFGWKLGTYVDLQVDARNNVSLNLNGQRATFLFTPHPLSFLFVWDLIPSYTPQGFHGSLTANGCSGLMRVQSNVVCFPDGSAYQPTIYNYTDPAGRVYTISYPSGSTSGLLQSIKDVNGNTLTVTANGITSSSGNVGVTFTRDPQNQNRITQIYLNQTPTVVYQYNYDTNGRLSSVQYPVLSAAAIYTYSPFPDNSLLTETDPRGQTSTAVYYSSANDGGNSQLDGRLQSITGPQVLDGNANQVRYTTTYVYDVPNSKTTTTITDPNNVVLASTVETDDSFGKPLSITDPLNRTTTYQYDSQENLISVIDAMQPSATTTYTYDTNGFQRSVQLQGLPPDSKTYNQFGGITSQTDAANSNTITTTYDANLNPVQMTDLLNGGGFLGSFTYDSQGNVKSYTDANQKATTFDYDPSGNLQDKIDALGEKTSYTYDAMGKVKTMKDACGNGSCPDITVGTTHTWTYTYDQLERLTDIADPNGVTTHYVYDNNGNKTDEYNAYVNATTFQRHTSYSYDNLNRLTTITYPDLTTKQFFYDFRGNKVTEIDQLNRTTRYVYDLAGQLTRVIYASGTADTGTVNYTYDLDGRLKTTKDEVGNITTNFYDPAGRLTSAQDARGNITQYGYDADSRKTSFTDANQHVTRNDYDARSRLSTITYADSTSTKYTYDGMGRVKTTIDQALQVTTKNYDDVGRMSSVVDAMPTGNTTTYAYDLNGNLKTITDANLHATSFQYDNFNRRAKRTLPHGEFETYNQYDVLGRLLSKTDFNLKTTTYTYDLLDRLLSKVPDPSFNPSQPTVSFIPTATGQRASMSDASGSTTYTNDNRDRVKTKATPEGTLTYSYDAHGNVKTIVSSNTNGASLAYSYDADNRLSTVADNRLKAQGAASWITTYSYDPASNLSNYTYPNSLGTTLTYDTLNRLTQTASGAVSSYTYTLGPAGNRTAVAEPSGRNVTYGYDPDYRLASETIAGYPANNGNIGYTYDFVGNRTQMTSTVSGIVGGSYSYDANDRLSTDTINANGNTTSSGGVSSGYDFENHMTTNGTTTIVYDGDGNRASETVGGATTKYLVDTANPTRLPQVVDETVNGAVTRTYAYGLQRINENQLVGSTWTPSFYGYDGHGNVRFLTSTPGTVTDTYQYDAFGRIIAVAGSTPNNFKYSGEWLDSNVGLFYLRARYMNPATGRFWARDPVEGKNCCGLSWNPYIYVKDNPVNAVDPTGRVDSLEYEEGSIGKFDVLTERSPVGDKLVNHHIIPDKFDCLMAKEWLITSLAIAIPTGGHQYYTNEWENIPELEGEPCEQFLGDIARAAEEIYEDEPDLLYEVKQWIKVLKDAGQY